LVNYKDSTPQRPKIHRYQPIRSFGYPFDPSATLRAGFLIAQGYGYFRADPLLVQAYYTLFILNEHLSRQGKSLELFIHFQGSGAAGMQDCPNRSLTSSAVCIMSSAKLRLGIL